MSESTNLVAIKRAQEEAIELLSERYAESVIDNVVLEQRLERVQQASSLEEIQAQVADLQQPGAAEQALAPRVETTALMQRPESHSVVAILGGTARKGRWVPGKVNYVVSVLGGSELDFREVALGSSTVDVQVTAVLGGTTITVPPEVVIENQVLGILGGVDVKGHSTAEPGNPNAPCIRIRGVAVLGGVEIRVKPRKS